MSEESANKVEVINFPKKNIWGKLCDLITILALIIAFCSLQVARKSLNLYIEEITKTANLELKILGFSDPAFIFNKGNFSEPKDFVIALHNTGNKDSNSLFFTIIFRNEITISLNKYIQTKSLDMNYLYYMDRWKKAVMKPGEEKTFTLNEQNFIIPKEGPPISIGKFEINIPKRDTGKIIIAIAFFHGDFPRNACIIYYDYSSKNYIIEHSAIEKAFEIWNPPIDSPS